MEVNSEEYCNTSFGIVWDFFRSEIFNDFSRNDMKLEVRLNASNDKKKSSVLVSAEPKVSEVPQRVTKC